MKLILTAMVGLMCITSCQQTAETAQSLPMVNSVEDINTQKATAIPLLTPVTYLVTGKITKRFFVWGKGYIRLADLNNEDLTLMVLTDHSRPLGEVITIRVTKQDMVEINEETFQIYVEQ